MIAELNDKARRAIIGLDRYLEVLSVKVIDDGNLSCGYMRYLIKGLGHPCYSVTPHYPNPKKEQA